MGIKSELKTKQKNVVEPVNPKKVYSTDPVTGTLPAEDTKVINTKAPSAKEIASNLSPEDQQVVEFNDEATSASSGHSLTDSDVIEGFDLTGMPEISNDPAPDAGQHEEAEPVSESSPPNQPASSQPAAKIKVAGMEFNNAEELAAYVAGLEANKVNLDKLFQPVVTDAPPVDPDPSDIIFEDPKRAVELIKKQVREEREAAERIKEQESQKIRAKEKVWADFYKTNPDLVGFEDIVETKLNEIPPETKFDVGLPLLAEKARARISEMRVKLVPSEVVSHSVAVTSSANKAAVPVQKPSEPVATSFIQELKGVRRKAN